MLKSPPLSGQGFGCTDTAPPENSSNYELSRILDMLQLAEELGIKKQVWDLLDSQIKMDYNYAKWSYVVRCWGRMTPTDLAARVQSPV
jgi:hypothetical protein